MKKIILGVITVIMVASMVACSSDEDTDKVRKVKENIKEDILETVVESNDAVENVSTTGQNPKEYEKLGTLDLVNMNGETLTMTEYEMDEEDISLYMGTFLSYKNREIKFSFEGPSYLTEVGEVNGEEFCIRNKSDSRAFIFYITDASVEGETIDIEKIDKSIEEYKVMTNDEIKEAIGLKGCWDVTLDEDTIELFYENYATSDSPYCGYSVAKIKLYKQIAFGSTYLENVSSYIDDNTLKIFDTFMIE